MTDVTTDLPLEWSATVDLHLETSSAGDNSDEDDAWQIPLEWSCVVDLDPPDDVEDDVDDGGP